MHGKFYIILLHFKTLSMVVLPHIFRRSILALLTCIFSLSLYAQEDQIHRDQRLDSLLQIKINMQKGYLLGKNYTIQIHSGSLNEGQRIMRDFENAFPNWPVMAHYETPNYKVWAGNFSARLSADQALRTIQRKFPSAFIFKPTLLRKETLTEEDEQEESSQDVDPNTESTQNQQ